MKTRIVSGLILFLLSAGILVAGVSCSTPANADDPNAGEAAPAFTVVDTNGNEHSLSDFAGKYVVLEWSNFGCPFVQKHYNSGSSFLSHCHDPACSLNRMHRLSFAPVAAIRRSIRPTGGCPA